MKTPKMRGQAFIIFKEIQSASNAVRALQGFPLFDKPMRVQYAKRDSEEIKALMGAQAEKVKKPQRKLDGLTEGEPKAKQKSKGSTALANMAMIQGTGEMPPNHILFVMNLPEETTEQMLQMLFAQFPGYKEVRLVPGRNDIAFIEYEDDEQANAAREAMQGFKITPVAPMKITFAKK
ncbi:unnamed protein product [Notodromas monacha]|uniref:RRM domain-containing protein n=1 Tax=Notodromas monacha TaxID=399045 RepID=A0A7R9BHS8_9CRUS|nr:unnamed protein product [Notodromas monacha]CAG0915740.1 unnamed protein product [Notodromas monacha]